MISRTQRTILLLFLIGFSCQPAQLQASVSLKTITDSVVTWFKEKAPYSILCASAAVLGVLYLWTKKNPKKSEKNPYPTSPTQQEPPQSPVNSPQEKPVEEPKTSQINYQNIPVKNQGANSQCGYYALKNGLIVLEYARLNNSIDSNDKRFTANNDERIFELKTWNQIFPSWQEEIVKYRKKRALAAWIQEKLICYIAKNLDEETTNDFRSVLFNTAQGIANSIIESDTEFESTEYTYITLKDTIQKAINASDKNVFLNDNFNVFLPNIEKLQFQLSPQIIATEWEKKYPNKTEDLDGDEIKDLLQITSNLQELRKNFTIIDDIEVAESQENFDTAAKKWHNHDNCMHLFLLGTMNQNYSNSSGHWYMVAAQKAKGQKTVFIADSIGTDRTNDPRVLKLIEKLNNYK